MSSNTLQEAKVNWLTNKKKEYAKLLFLKTSSTGKEIAERVGVSEVTLSKCARQSTWKQLKVSTVITKDELLKSLYAQLYKLNKEAEKSTKGYASNKQADVISKLGAAIKSMETEVGTSGVIVDVFIKFNDWLRVIDIGKAKEITPLQGEFIKTLIAN